MAKLPAVKPRQVIRFLEQNGFLAIVTCQGER